MATVRIEDCEERLDRLYECLFGFAVLGGDGTHCGASDRSERLFGVPIFGDCMGDAMTSAVSYDDSG